MEKEIRAWGTPYNPAFKRAPDYKCLDCGFDFVSMRVTEKTCQAVVGFSLDNPGHSSKSSHIVGILIVECPQCFEKFWFHVTASWLQAVESFQESLQQK